MTVAGEATMVFNPSRLALARRRRGLTKRELAEAAQLSERSIVAYESGATVPTDATVEQLARALAFPVAFLHRADVDAIPEGSASFRSMARMTAAQRDRALAGGALALELTAWTEARFGLPPADVPDLRHCKDPEAAAGALRQHWRLGDGPITHMVRLIEAKGVRVFSLAEQCRELDAFSFWRAGTPFVFLNTMKSAERGRFDAAHELAHLAMHRHGEPNGREAEREADAFASAFLMPRSGVLAGAPRVPSLERLTRLKRQWNVALSAYAHRLHDIGVLSDWHYRRLVIEIQQRGFRRAEPDGGPREMSLVFEKVFDSLRKEKVSRADVARELDWPLAELNALVFGLVMTAGSGGAKDSRAPSSRGGSTLHLVGGGE